MLFLEGIMDEIYPIEVLHVLNPHVIFVEVRDSSEALVIDQIGIYGITPVNQTIDIDGKIVKERCENWPAVATTAINELLVGVADTYFMLVQDEIRSTIFNKKSIKFGQILIKTGKQIISLKDHLEKLNVAEYNEVIFHHRLSSGSLKLKLSYVRSEEVLKAIKKYYQKHKSDKKWQEAIDKQTTLYKESKKIANKLTAKNLELLERNEEQPYSVMALIDRKTKDLDLCKDADEMSLGCGVRRNKTPSIEKPSEIDNESPLNVMHQIRKYLAANAKIKCKYDSDLNRQLNLSCHSEKEIDCQQYEAWRRSHENSPEYKENDDFWDKPYNTIPNKNKDVGKDKNDVQESFNTNISPVSPIQLGHKSSVPKLGEPTSKINKSREILQMMMMHTKTSERLVAYGPPSTFDLSKLKIQKVTNDAPSPYAIKIEERREQVNEEKNIYNDDDVDSNVDFKFSDKLDKKHELNCQNDDRQTKKMEVNNYSPKANVCETKDENHSEKLSSKNKLLKLLKRKAKAQLKDNLLSSDSNTSLNTSSKENEDDIELIKEKLKSKYKPLKYEIKIEKPTENISKTERNVNPFMNLDGSKSVFVEKLVGPILMVHTKNDNLILPQRYLRDIPFKTDIHIALKNMNFKEPLRLQSVSWSYILRGHSVFMVSHARGGKSFGYIPAVCNLVMDSTNIAGSLGPICVIVCATAASVTAIEVSCKRFLGLDEVVLSCFPGVDMTEFMTALLNGCHILIITAPMLYKLLGTDFGVDFRRLTTLVFEDGERLSEMYASEIKVILYHVKDLLKNRADSSWKVQYVVASRQWCDFMTPLAKNAPDTVIAISAFQECVPYSKAPTSVQFVLKDNKINAVLDFLNEIDRSKRSVIVCRSDDEVESLENALKNSQHTVFTCNNAMTVHDLYNLIVAWDEYREPVLGPILICCDGNLTHMNVTNAHYLVHFSMPELFSMFCKRFAVLNDNYASIFESQNQSVKIKILLEESNSEQLPKILNFVERCTSDGFPMLSQITQQVLEEKDVTKAKNLVPICNSLMMLGECADVWNCNERHAILKDYDEPKPWMPKEGMINFKITFYSSAVTYSARLLSNVTKSGISKYPNNFNTLSLKMGMYYSKMANRKPQGIIKLGDISAIAVKPNFFKRCQVIRILSYHKGNPYIVRVNLIDEEKIEDTKDVELFHLPEEFKAIETHVVKVRLANIQPQDKDVTFSALAMNMLKKITEDDENLYLRGEVVMTIGNCIFVDSLEACKDLSSLGETVVKYDFKKELLSRHAERNPEHITKLQKLGGMVAKTKDNIEVAAPKKVIKHPKWAHLDKDDFSAVIFAAAENAGQLFVRLDKFKKVIDLLVKDIQNLVETMEELRHEDIYVGNIVLAQYPDDCTYERARIDVVINKEKVKCFFVDNGDWREVSIKYLRPIPDNIINRVPFQAIECRLVGVKPYSDEWTEFSTNWLCDNCIEDSQGNTKCLFAKYFTKEEANITGGHKYGVILVDTSSENDVVINKQMIDLNLVRECDDEAEFLNRPLDMNSIRISDSSEDDFLVKPAINTVKDVVPMQTSEVHFENSALKQILFKRPLRSVPLVNDSDDSGSDISINFSKEELMTLFKKGTIPVSVDETNKDFINNEQVKINAITVVPKPQNELENSKETDSTISIVHNDSDDIDTGREKKAFASLKDLLRNRKASNPETRTNLNKSKDDIDSDDFSSTTSSIKNNANVNNVKSEYPKIIDVTNSTRKPKLIWRQNRSSVSVKIQLIGVENYTLDIKEKSMKFYAYHNDTYYEFESELYGVVDVKKCMHSSKGQYILVVMQKVMQRNWLNLFKDCTVKNWISYDVDAIGFSSEEEVELDDEGLKALRNNLDQDDTDSDEEFFDDANFSYKKEFYN